MDAFKVLGQSVPGGTLTAVYTCPAGTSRSAVVSSITICNPTPMLQTFRVSIAVSGAADTQKQYLYYDTPVPANDTFIATVGLTLSARDELRALCSNGLMSVQAFGSEVS